MSLRKLPEARTFQRPQNFQWDAPSDVLARWAEAPRAAASDDDTTISMFEVIGEDWWSGGGVTAKRISAALRSIGDRDVTVTHDAAPTATHDAGYSDVFVERFVSAFKPH